MGSLSYPVPDRPASWFSRRWISRRSSRPVIARLRLGKWPRLSNSTIPSSPRRFDRMPACPFTARVDTPKQSPRKKKKKDHLRYQILPRRTFTSQTRFLLHCCFCTPIVGQLPPRKQIFTSLNSSPSAIVVLCVLAPKHDGMPWTSSGSPSSAASQRS